MGKTEMGNSSSKKNGERQRDLQSRNGLKEPPRVSLVMRMSRMSRISMDNAFKQLKQANSIRRRVHGKVQEDAAMGTPGTWRKNRGGEHSENYDNIESHDVVWNKCLTRVDTLKQENAADRVIHINRGRFNKQNSMKR